MIAFAKCAAYNGWMSCCQMSVSGKHMQTGPSMMKAASGQAGRRPPQMLWRLSTFSLRGLMHQASYNHPAAVKDCVPAYICSLCCVPPDPIRRERELTQAGLLGQFKSKIGAWIDAPPIDGTLLVVIGQMVSLYCNGIYQASCLGCKQHTSVCGTGDLTSMCALNVSALQRHSMCHASDSAGQRLFWFLSQVANAELWLAACFVCLVSIEFLIAG